MNSNERFVERMNLQGEYLLMLLVDRRILKLDWGVYKDVLSSSLQLVSMWWHKCELILNRYYDFAQHQYVQTPYVP